ncbi:MAG: hypothetical protein HPY66_2173 [Firmicutes bacterium]|nr:hypothetical protein [Bacillota bacterium]MDI6706750.1 hypothetical protein [Bacillota bacterium]
MSSMCEIGMGYIPEEKVRAVIVDGRIPDEIERNLISDGINVIKTVRHPRLYDAISYHPDAVVCPLGGGKLVVEPLMFGYLRDALREYRVTVIKGETELSSNYPGSTAYNIAAIGEKVILNPTCADPVALREFEYANLLLVKVKQGYTKCSTAIIASNTIITSDKGIAKAASESGVEVLTVRSEGVQLKGFEYGLIGGCCGRISKDCIVFAGDPGTHPDWQQIHNFLKEHRIKPKRLYDGPLIDIGSIIPVVEIF